MFQLQKKQKTVYLSIERYPRRSPVYKKKLLLFVVNIDYMGIFWNKCSEW